MNEKPQIEVPSDQPPSYQLELDDITVGEGEEAKPGKVVEVHYVGVSWSTGEQFDASWDRGDTFKFALGKGKVIQGWDEGVAGMRVGGRRRITIPPNLGLRKARRRRRDRPRRDTRLRRGPHRRTLSASSLPRTGLVNRTRVPLGCAQAQAHPCVRRCGRPYPGRHRVRGARQPGGAGGGHRPGVRRTWRRAAVRLLRGRGQRGSGPGGGGGTPAASRAWPQSVKYSSRTIVPSRNVATWWYISVSISAPLPLPRP